MHWSTEDYAMSRVLALRFAFVLLLALGSGTSAAYADTFPFNFTLGIGTDTYTFQTYSLTQNISVHCLSGCPDATYVNYFPEEGEIQFGSIWDTRGNTFADYSFGSDFFTLGSHSDGIYTMNVTQVPEPSTFSLLGLGLIGILGIAKKKMGTFLTSHTVHLSD